MARDASSSKRWSEEETILALYLYFQLPFGKLHSRNPEIQQLAAALGRTNSSIAMKLSNFASLDPKITESGRKGLPGATALDRAIYAEFGRDWTGLVKRAEVLWSSSVKGSAEQISESRVKEGAMEFRFAPFEGKSTRDAVVSQRVGQGFFRRAVLANYDNSCAISGIADQRLLIASHIKPWVEDVENRHNPANGLLLSATLDRAFDIGLLTVDKNHKVHICRNLYDHVNDETREYFRPFHLRRLRKSVRFDPDQTFLEWHNRNCYVDGPGGL